MDEIKIMTFRFHFKIFFLSILLLCLATTAAPVLAQQKFVRAQGTGVDRAAALAAARLTAWRNYLGTQQGAKLDNILANERTFLDALESIVVDL